MAVKIMLSRLLFILMRGFCCCLINFYCCSHCALGRYVGALFCFVDLSVSVICNHLVVEEKPECCFFISLLMSC